jgi:hypothetical protein
MLLDRNTPGDRERAAELIAAGRAAAEQLGMAREIVRFEGLRETAGVSPCLRCSPRAAWDMIQGMETDSRALRRWLNGRRAAEARERAERGAAHPSPAESWRQALLLIAFASRRSGWPLPDDPRSLHEDGLAYARWERLRAAWRQSGGRLH